MIAHYGKKKPDNYNPRVAVYPYPNIEIMQYPYYMKYLK